MGATVCTSIRASYFRRQDGRLVVVVEEQGYEKNVYPHTPRWSVRFVGSVEQAVALIFDSASCCEGGLLQGPSGAIRPEGYIRKGLEALRNARPISQHATFHVYGTGWYRVLDEENADRRDAVLSVLRAALPAELVEAILKGGEAFFVREHGDLLADLAQHVRPWRMLRDGVRFDADAPVLDALVEASAAGLPEVRNPMTEQVYRVEDGSHRGTIAMPCEDGRYALESGYVAIADFVKQAWPLEIRTPGAGVKAIRAYRKWLQKSVPPLRLNEAVIEVASDARYICQDVREAHGKTVQEYLDGGSYIGFLSVKEVRLRLPASQRLAA